jgi:hypothetical protein
MLFDRGQTYWLVAFNDKSMLCLNSFNDDRTEVRIHIIKGLKPKGKQLLSAAIGNGNSRTSF